MLVSRRSFVVFFQNWTVARSKITKKRDEQTERGNREIIERTEKDRPDISWSLSCQPIHYSSRAAYKCATHAGVSLIRFMCLSSDVDQPIRYFQPVNTFQHTAKDTVEYRVTSIYDSLSKNPVQFSSYRNVQSKKNRYWTVKITVNKIETRINR